MYLGYLKFEPEKFGFSLDFTGPALHYVFVEYVRRLTKCVQQRAASTHTPDVWSTAYGQLKYCATRARPEVVSSSELSVVLESLLRKVSPSQVWFEPYVCHQRYYELRGLPDIATSDNKTHHQPCPDFVIGTLPYADDGNTFCPFTPLMVIEQKNDLDLRADLTQLLQSCAIVLDDVCNAEIVVMLPPDSKGKTQEKHVPLTLGRLVFGLLVSEEGMHLIGCMC